MKVGKRFGTIMLSMIVVFSFMFSGVTAKAATEDSAFGWVGSIEVYNIENSTEESFIIYSAGGTTSVETVSGITYDSDAGVLTLNNFNHEKYHLNIFGLEGTLTINLKGSNALNDIAVNNATAPGLYITGVGSLTVTEGIGMWVKNEESIGASRIHVASTVSMTTGGTIEIVGTTVTSVDEAFIFDGIVETTPEYKNGNGAFAIINPLEIASVIWGHISVHSTQGLGEEGVHEEYLFSSNGMYDVVESSNGVSYDVEKNEITMNNVNLPEGNLFVDVEAQTPVKIILKGDNHIGYSQAYTNQTVSFEGDGSLEVHGNFEVGVEGKLHFGKDATVTFSNTAAESNSLISFFLNKVSDTNSLITYDGDISEPINWSSAGESSYYVKNSKLIFHTHKAGEWEHDELNHWQTCTICNTVIGGGSKPHEFDDKVTKEPTEKETGVRTYTCKDCGYSKTEEIAKLPHTHKESGWQSDADGHWKICEDCKEVIVEKAPHIKDAGTVTKAATEAEAGVMTYKCTECGYSWTEEIAKLAPATTEAPKTTETPATTEAPKTETPVTVGTTTTDDSGATYTVTESESGETEVEYTAADTTAKKVSIPSTVTLADGTTATVTSIADNAFSGNKTITAVTIPATVEEIGDNAFKNCTKLKNVTIPQNVEEVGKNAFAGCTSLTKVTVKGNSLTKVDQGAFKNCKKLTMVTLPKTVTSIGKDAFSGDKKLKTITIKSTKLKTVGKNAFKNVPSSTTIKVPAKQKKAYTKLLKKSGFKGKIK